MGIQQVFPLKNLNTILKQQYDPNGKSNNLGILRLLSVTLKLVPSTYLMHEVWYAW